MERRTFAAAMGGIVLSGLAGCARYEQYVREANRDDGEERTEGGHQHTEGGQQHTEGGHQHTESHGSQEQHDGSAQHGHGSSKHDHGGSLDGPVERAEVGMMTNRGHHFMPHLVWVQEGGTVTWTCESGTHTATAYHAKFGEPSRVPADTAAWDSGVLGTGESFEYTFEKAGVYDYYCRPHEGMGMVGKVIVGHPDPHDQSGLAEPSGNLPKTARDVITRLNEDANEALGHTH